MGRWFRVWAPLHPQRNRDVQVRNLQRKCTHRSSCGLSCIFSFIMEAGWRLARRVYPPIPSRMSVLKKKFPDERTFGPIRPGSDGHLFNSTGCERTSRKFVPIILALPDSGGHPAQSVRRLTDIQEKIAFSPTLVLPHVGTSEDLEAWISTSMISASG